MVEQLNILPFICEAFSTNKLIHRNIDEIYNTDRLRYYNTAKASPYYDHAVCDEGSILQEYYYKKILGILLEAEKDEGLTMEIIEKLIKKGWEKAYNYIMSNKHVDIEKFINGFLRKSKGINNIDDDYLNSNILIAILLSVLYADAYKKNIIENEFYEYVRNAYTNRKELQAMKDEIYDIEKLDKEVKNKLIEIEKIIKDQGIISFRPLDFKYKHKENDAQRIDLKKMTSLEKYISCFDYIYDYENLAIISVVGNDYLNSKEIREMIYIYKTMFPEELEKEKIDYDKLISYLYPAIQIRYLCREYKKAKKLFFQNFNEELNNIINEKTLEIEKLIGEINLTKEEYEKLIKENNRLLTIISKMEKENKRFKKELETKKDNKKELYSLREFIFNLDNKEEYTEIDDENYENLKRCKGIIVGGHDNWQRKMKELLPNFKFISTDALNFDVSILNDKEPIFIYTNYLNHGLYYKLINEIRKKDIPLYYLSYNINEKITLKQISNHLDKLHK